MHIFFSNIIKTIIFTGKQKYTFIVHELKPFFSSLYAQNRLRSFHNQQLS